MAFNFLSSIMAPIKQAQKAVGQVQVGQAQKNLQNTIKAAKKVQSSGDTQSHVATTSSWAPYAGSVPDSQPKIATTSSWAPYTPASYTPKSVSGGSSGAGGSGYPSGSSGGGVPSTPAAPPIAPKPAPPPEPPALTSDDYDKLVQKAVATWNSALGNDERGTNRYSNAAKHLNTYIKNQDNDSQLGYTSAIARALYDNGNIASANSLTANGILDDTVMPVNPAEAAPVTETVIIPDAKSDSLYKRQSADIAQQLADFVGDQQLANTQYDNQYADVLRKMGFNKEKNAWDSSPTSGAYGESTDDNLNDFTGRGLGWSGLLAQGQAQIDRKFNEQKGDIDTQSQNFDDSQARALQTTKNQNARTLQAALEDAITRISQQYGVDRNQVKVGSNNSITREKA
jgi:hypothetical protein